MKNTALLRRRLLSRRAVISVIGQGYVGLSLACAAAEEGFSVFGIDIDQTRRADLADGILSVPGVQEDVFLRAIEAGRITFTGDFDPVGDSDIILICVPTPVRDHTPDLSLVEEATKEAARFIRPGCLVVLESSTYPGTTEEVVAPLLETSGLVAGHDFLLAYSPERIDPGNETYGIRTTPRIVGGFTRESAGVVALFYRQLVDDVTIVSSCRAAELAKLLENTFRHVNIGLVNEMAMICNDMGIDVWEVINAAATKPFGFMPFFPGPGVGGHCIPVDPAYLAWQVRRDAGRQFRILEEAQDVNSQMPTYVCSRIADALNDSGRAVKGANVLVLGVAYKADVGDVRESPALRVMNILERRGAKVSYHDPYVEQVFYRGSSTTRSDLSTRSLQAADCVALLTPHSAYDLDWIAAHSTLVFDARNAYGEKRRANVVTL
jgi:nucleotide sugar dehydrogenase